MEYKYLGAIKSINKRSGSYHITFEEEQATELFILNDHVIRYALIKTGDLDKTCQISEDARINLHEDYDKLAFQTSLIKDSLGPGNTVSYTIQTKNLKITFDKKNGTMTVTKGDKEIFRLIRLGYSDTNTIQELTQSKEEYFFGGGMLPREGRGSYILKGEVIDIAVANHTWPCPFYWSTNGYGVLRNTWSNGRYDFSDPSKVTLTHECPDFDSFFFISDTPEEILGDFFELVGSPPLMPEYAFYEAYFGLFHGIIWEKTEKGEEGAILFEDDSYYKKTNTKNPGQTTFTGSLNGDKSKDDYMFSARAVIDRYHSNDIPLGWIVPNNNGSYGDPNRFRDTENADNNLKADIKNLQKFSNYARENNVRVGLFIGKDSDEENLRKAIKHAGIVALENDEDEKQQDKQRILIDMKKRAAIFSKVHEKKNRLLSLTSIGWAGTQRYSGFKHGKTYNGDWEDIRFNVPSYIASGLSGQPIIGAVVDGDIFLELDEEVNIRQYQWTTFTPMQLNIDSISSPIRKSPFSFSEDATNINRAYLKLKASLMPYNYTIAHRAISGLPMMRAMFLEFPNDMPSYTKDCLHQYMWGPYFLIAPIYKEEEDSRGKFIRNGIYLPDENQVWVDYFTGMKYQGGRVINELQFPTWKLPVFIKDGAIIPYCNPHNNAHEIKRDLRSISIYPNGESSFTIYEDDGISCDYEDKVYAETLINVKAPKTNEKGDLEITINATKGNYADMELERYTVIHIVSSNFIDRNITATVNEMPVTLIKVINATQFVIVDNAIILDRKFTINPYIYEIGGKEIYQSFLLIKIKKHDVSNSSITIRIKDYENKVDIYGRDLTEDSSLAIPENLMVKNIEKTGITMTWDPAEGAKYYDIERDGLIFSHFYKKTTEFKFKRPPSIPVHKFRIRSMKGNRVSPWSPFVEVTPPYVVDDDEKLHN